MLTETARRKLLRIRPAKDNRRLDVQFVTNGKYDDNLEQKHSGGFTCWGMGDDGTIRILHVEHMSGVVDYLIQDDLHQV